MYLLQPANITFFSQMLFVFVFFLVKATQWWKVMKKSLFFFSPTKEFSKGVPINTND